MKARKRRDYSKFFSSSDVLRLEAQYALHGPSHDFPNHDIHLGSTHTSMSNSQTPSEPKNVPIGAAAYSTPHQPSAQVDDISATVAPLPDVEPTSRPDKSSTWSQVFRHLPGESTAAPFPELVELLPSLCTTEKALSDLRYQLETHLRGSEAFMNVIADIQDDLDKLCRDFKKLLRDLGRDLTDAQEGAKEKTIAEAVQNVKDIQDACYRSERRYLAVKEAETSRVLAKEQKARMGAVQGVVARIIGFGLPYMKGWIFTSG